MIDATPEKMYPLASSGFSGGSQVYVKAVIRGLLAQGHTVHVIANDLETDEQRGPAEFWWPPSYHPHKADAVVVQMHIRENPPYEAPIAVLMTSCIDPYLGANNQWAGQIDAIPVFSEVHKRLLARTRPGLPEDRMFITGLGVDLEDYRLSLWGEEEWDRHCETPGCNTCQRLSGDWRQGSKVKGRMLYANDPARGLFYTLDIFDLVRKEIPTATLHVAYDFDRQFGYRQWEHSQMAQMLWDCKRRLETTPGVVKVGAPDRAGIIREELECQVHCMPSDPPGVGTQTHGIMQMECGAAGAALVLSDIEAFPEVFQSGATIMPVIGRYEPRWERTTTVADYATVIIGLMTSPELWAIESRKARALAERNTWAHVMERWAKMLAATAERLGVPWERAA